MRDSKYVWFDSIVFSGVPKIPNGRLLLTIALFYCCVYCCLFYFALPSSQVLLTGRIFIFIVEFSLMKLNFTFTLNIGYNKVKYIWKYSRKNKKLINDGREQYD